MARSPFVKLAEEAFRLEDELTKVRGERDKLDTQARAVREYLCVVFDATTRDIQGVNKESTLWSRLNSRLTLAQQLARKIDAGEFEDPKYYAIVGPSGSIGYTAGELGKKRALERDPNVKFRPITKVEYDNFARDED